jgi:hypothetical protein
VVGRETSPAIGFSFETSREPITLSTLESRRLGLSAKSKFAFDTLFSLPTAVLEFEGLVTR